MPFIKRSIVKINSVVQEDDLDEKEKDSVKKISEQNKISQQEKSETKNVGSN